VVVLGDDADRHFWATSNDPPEALVLRARTAASFGWGGERGCQLAGLGVESEVVSVRGSDREGREIARMLLRRGIGSEGLVEAPGRTTTEKVRIIARSQQVVRADFEPEDAVDGTVRRAIYDRVRARAATANALVISDYGKGVVLKDELADVIAAWRTQKKPVLVDPHVPHFEWYRGVTVVTPNTREAQLAAGVDYRKGKDPAAAVFEVDRRMEQEALVVTRGEDGMSLYYGDRQEVHIPTVAKHVFDVTGACDTVISVLAAGLATKADLVDAVVMQHGGGRSDKEVGLDAFGGGIDRGPSRRGLYGPARSNGDPERASPRGRRRVAARGQADRVHQRRFDLARPPRAAGRLRRKATRCWSRSMPTSRCEAEGPERPAHPAQRAETCSR
jgi:D-beta-D-heptose 7-phosphate kinase/D-beta-D-heptose 1-phosphate adenosyltransferase